METEIDQETPYEYQLFALAFKQSGAISEFHDSLPPSMVGAIHGNTGLHEFYQALLDFYDKTGLDPVDPIAFKAWLESETEIYEAVGGASGIDMMLDMVMGIELSTVDSVIKILRHRANKRRQIDALQELQLLVTKKTHKSDQDLERISLLTNQIRSLEKEIDYNPLDSVSTATDIAARAGDLTDIPEMLPTPFKSYNKALGYDSEYGGYFRGAVHAVVAISGQGKSTFSKNLMNHWVDLGNTVLYINYEEVQAHWETVLFTQVIKENVYANAKKWTEKERQDKIMLFQEKLKAWNGRFLVKHDPDTLYFDDLEKWLRDIMGHNDIVPDVVIIDTIQSLLGKGSVRWGQFEMMMVQLEKLARDMDAVFVLTAQQNVRQAAEGREVVEQRDVAGST